jgi:hypothetical protein
VVTKKIIRATCSADNSIIRIAFSRKTKIHLCKLPKQVEKIAFGDLFWPVSQREQIHFVFTEIYVYCVYLAMPKSLNSNCNISLNRNKRRSSRFPWYLCVYIVSVSHRSLYMDHASSS